MGRPWGNREGISESRLFASRAARDLVCSSLLLACFHGTSSSRTSLEHRDGPIELSPQSVIGPTSGSGVAFRGRLGKSRRQLTGGALDKGSYGPPCVHTQDISKTNDGKSQDIGTPQRRRRIKRRFGRLALSAHFTARPGLARRRALHPPRRLIPNLTTGAMRNCLDRAWPAPSPAHYSAPSGVLHDTPLVSHWPVPATTDGSVEPHTHHRRPPHASAVLAHQRDHMWGEMGERIVQYGLPRKIVDMRPLRGLPDPILQIFNSRLVGLGKCRMNQVSSQSGRIV